MFLPPDLLTASPVAAILPLTMGLVVGMIVKKAIRIATAFAPAPPLSSSATALGTLFSLAESQALTLGLVSADAASPRNRQGRGAEARYRPLPVDLSARARRTAAPNETK
jgi:hypothetical protein